jgi:hypothetical protein
VKTRRFIFPVLVCLGATFALAENTTATAPNPVVKTPTTATAEVSTPDLPGTVAGKPARSRAVSNEVSASILAGMPKYNPPPKKPEPKPGDVAPDLRETDKPRNGIIRLPEHVVREKRPPVLQDRAALTQQGLADVATRRYITETDRALNSWNIFGVRQIGPDSTTQRALDMYAEDERLKNMADLNETARDAAKSSSAESVYIKRATQDTYMRSMDPIWTPRK